MKRVVTTLVALSLAAPVAAHEGHDLGAVVVDVIARSPQAGETRLELAITNYGAQPVVVMGVGFVGAVMAGVVADSTGEGGDPLYFVIGMQRPSTRSFWKIPYINRGVAPVEAEDPEVAGMDQRGGPDAGRLVVNP